MQESLEMMLEALHCTVPDFEVGDMKWWVYQREEIMIASDIAEAVLAAAYAAFAIGITMITRNIFVSMTSAFVYSVLENFVTAILQVPAWSICTSFYPNRLSSNVITIPGLLAGPLVLFLVTVILFICYRLKGMESLMD